MDSRLEANTNVGLSTASASKYACRLLVAVAVSGAIAGCSLWSGDGSNEPMPTARTSQVEPTITATATLTPSTPPSHEPTATPPPTVAVEELEPSTRLAYFHSVSAQGESPELLAQAVDFITLTSGDDAYRDALRQAGYSGLILQYLNASLVNGPGPYLNSAAPCDDAFEPHRNGFARGIGVFCHAIHPNEDWFLHNGAGERLYTVIGESSVWYHMDPGNAGWRAFASQEIARDIVGPEALGFDGLLLDNVELSLFRLTDQAQNADGVVREYETDAAYQTSWADYLRQIRARIGNDVVLWASFVSDPNTGTTWTTYLESLNGVMSPAFATGYEPLSVDAWENNVGQAEAAVVSGKGLVAVGQGPRDNADLMRFALASYLLVSDEDDAYFRYMSNESVTSILALWTFPEYEIALGAALGPRTKTGTTWRREFQCGYVEADPVDRTGAIVQTPCRSGLAP